MVLAVIATLPILGWRQITQITLPEEERQLLIVVARAALLTRESRDAWGRESFAGEVAFEADRAATTKELAGAPDAAQAALLAREAQARSAQALEVARIATERASAAQDVVFRPIWELMFDRNWVGVQWRWTRISAVQRAATKASQEALTALQTAKERWEEIRQEEQLSGFPGYTEVHRAAGLLDDKAKMAGHLARQADDDVAIAWEALLAEVAAAIVRDPDSRKAVLADVIQEVRREP